MNGMPIDCSYQMSFIHRPWIPSIYRVAALAVGHDDEDVGS